MNDPVRSDPPQPLMLTDAGMETVLLFQEGIDLPCFAVFPLIDTEAGRAALRRYYQPFLELAREHEAPFVLGAPTWRANPDWGAQLGYEGEALDAVNGRAVAFVDEIRRDARPGGGGPAILLEALVGPRGDGYAPASTMSAEQAEAYHSTQLRALASSAVDQVAAITITYAQEAIGIVRAAAAVGLPITIGFTLETDGQLPSGQALGAAIEQVDGETDGGAFQYMINCAHPTHFAGTLAAGGAWRTRIGGVRANASTLSHAELDEAEELDDGDPADLAARYVALRNLLPNLSVVGGCCGTDIRHVSAICEALHAPVR